MLLLRRIFGQRQNNIRVPGAVEIEPLILLLIAIVDIHARRVHAEQAPGERTAARMRRGHARHYGSATGAAVHTRVGQEIAVALKAHAEGRCDNRLTRHRQVMQSIVKTKREAGDQHWRADLDIVEPGD